MSRFLLLWAEAPLQAWGTDSKFYRRDTVAFPTKSGVLGILLAGSGLKGAQTELLQEMALLRQTVVAYRPHVDGPNLLQDFQMVGSGYDDNDAWERLCVPKTSEGKKAVGGGTKLTYRYYLVNSKFAIIVEIPEAMEVPFTEGLLHPVYDLYLGRKCCIPTESIFQGAFESMEVSLQKAEVIANAKGLVEAFRVVDGTVLGEESLVIADVPLSFGERKRYRQRIVTVLNAQ